MIFNVLNGNITYTVQLLVAIFSIVQLLNSAIIMALFSMLLFYLVGALKDF